MRKIVIVRGLATAGKSTTSHELAKVLPGWIFIDVWKIKEMFEPLGMKDRRPWIDITKKTMIYIMREVIRKFKINILVQETSRSFLIKYLGKDLRKCNYKVYSFFLDIDLKEAIKRDKRREKPTMRFGKFNSEDEWRKGRASPERGDKIMHTGKNSTKEVVDIILNEIGEKREKHPRAHLIRRSW